MATASATASVIFPARFFDCSERTSKLDSKSQKYSEGCHDYSREYQLEWTYLSFIILQHPSSLPPRRNSSPHPGRANSQQLLIASSYDASNQTPEMEPQVDPIHSPPTNSRMVPWFGWPNSAMCASFKEPSCTLLK
jgi:hypothetical protein